ncbi:hypothetical protein L3Q72_15670 [Vibrio sp. JC009]|uniref:hypothetical protein n=1 Tax=Vibrio sp. JC009 TaxID=2912314 RepID=UPI0023AFF928|nr:hypothetical protein [Vibrio sp. JC009]WED24316.1 hypothetical protein L3Q72_15670 [Vibrio sp. JC009]
MTEIKYKLYGVEGNLTLTCPKLSQKITNLYQAAAFDHLIFELAKMIFPECHKKGAEARCNPNSSDSFFHKNGLSDLLIATEDQCFKRINLDFGQL